MKNPTKRGQQFKRFNEILTVKSFAGKTGIEYGTFDEAKKKNPTDTLIMIINKEYDGYSDQKDCILID